MASDPKWMETGVALKAFWERAVVIPEGAKPVAAYDWYRDFLAMLLQGGHHVWFAKVVVFGEMAIGRSLAEWLAREDHGTFPGREIGVIAGSNGFGLGMFVAPEMPEPNDGAVAVEETKLPAACDHIVLPVSHSGMLISHALANQVAAFWHNGSFTRETAAA